MTQTTVDELTAVRRQLENFRVMSSTHHDRRLPLLLASAPEQLRQAFEDYAEARRNAQDADEAAALADAAIDTARDEEIKEIKRRVRAGEPLDGMPDVVREAELAFRRLAQAFTVQAGALKMATGRLVETAVEYRDTHLQTCTQPLAEAGRAVDKARANLRDAEHHRDLIGGQATWWSRLAPTNLPTVGGASDAEVAEAIAATQGGGWPRCGVAADTPMSAPSHDTPPRRAMPGGFGPTTRGSSKTIGQCRRVPQRAYRRSHLGTSPTPPDTSSKRRHRGSRLTSDRDRPGRDAGAVQFQLAWSRVTR